MLANHLKFARRFSTRLHHVTKFYKDAVVVPFADPAADLTGFSVRLDKKSLTTADGHRYFVPSPWLAHVVCLEFLAQKDYIIASSMPMVVDADRSLV